MLILKINKLSPHRELQSLIFNAKSISLISNWKNFPYYVYLFPLHPVPLPSSPGNQPPLRKAHRPPLGHGKVLLTLLPFWSPLPMGKAVTLTTGGYGQQSLLSKENILQGSQWMPEPQIISISIYIDICKKNDLFYQNVCHPLRLLKIPQVAILGDLNCLKGSCFFQILVPSHCL
jgi:hypothetical protein